MEFITKTPSSHSETATKAVNQDMLDEYLAKNNQALTELVEVHGVELRKVAR